MLAHNSRTLGIREGEAAPLKTAISNSRSIDNAHELVIRDFGGKEKHET